MFLSEAVILMTIAMNKGSGKKLINRSMDVTGEYIGHLCDSLVSRGYLKGNRAKGYQLISMGRGTLVEFLLENETRVKDTIRKLKQLSVEYSQGIDKPRKEQLGQVGKQNTPCQLSLANSSTPEGLDCVLPLFCGVCSKSRMR